MRHLLHCLFLMSGVIVMLGCSGQPQQTASNNTPTSNQSSNLDSMLSAGGGQNTAPANSPPQNAGNNLGSSNDSGNLLGGDRPADLGSDDADDANENEADGETSASKGDSGDALKKSGPAPLKDVFGRERPDMSIAAGGGGAGMVSNGDQFASGANPSSDHNHSDEHSNDGGDADSNDDRSTASSNAREAKPQSFFELAEQEFAKQHESDAFQYLYAHALTDEKALRETPMAWYNGGPSEKIMKKDPKAKGRLGEPRLALRWGVGIVYDVTGDFDGDPPVIGGPSDSDSSDSDGTDGSRSGGGLSISGPPDRSIGARNRASKSADRNNSRREREAKSPREELPYYTGDYGTLFLKRLEKRRTHEGGFYGKILAMVDTDRPAVDQSENDNLSSSPSADVPAGNVDDDLGMLSGGGGAVQPPGGRRNNSSNDNASDDDDDRTKTGLQPGVTMIGVDRLSDLLKKAKAMGVDVLAVFEVDVKTSSRTDITTSTTRLALYSVKSGVLILRGKSLKNTAVEKAREKNRDDKDDPVELALDLVFADYADKEWRSSDFPETIANHVSARISKLIDSEPQNPLPTLVEIRQYHEMGFIDEAEMASAFEALVGSSVARDLIEGSDSEKRKALASWMPGNFVTGPSSSGGDFR